MRGFIVLKRQFKLIDCEGKGSLSLNDFLQAFDDLKITNLQSGELKMIFGIYDNFKSKQHKNNLYENFIFQIKA